MPLNKAIVRNLLRLVLFFFFAPFIWWCFRNGFSLCVIGSESAAWYTSKGNICVLF